MFNADEFGRVKPRGSGLLAGVGSGRRAQQQLTQIPLRRLFALFQVPPPVGRPAPGLGRACTSPDGILAPLQSPQNELS
jgi:hypothetical protein